MSFDARELLRGFSRKSLLGVGGGAAGILGIGLFLHSQVSALHTKYQQLNQELAATPDAPADDPTAKLMSKAEGLELEKKVAKFKKIKQTLEGFIPKAGEPKPAIITINDLVQKIPSTIDVDRSEKSEDAPMLFSEQSLTGVTDPKNPKPVYRYQSVAYGFTMRTTYTALVDFLKEVDLLKTFYFVRELSIKPLTDSQNITVRDPKFTVELELQTIYLLNQQAAKQ